MWEIVCGLTVFFTGLGMLGFVFYLAYSAFTDPTTLSRFAELVPSMGEGNIETIAEEALKVMALSLGTMLLWVMGSIGGRIATQGVKMMSREKREEKG